MHITEVSITERCAYYRGARRCAFEFVTVFIADSYCMSSFYGITFKTIKTTTLKTNTANVKQPFGPVTTGAFYNGCFLKADVIFEPNAICLN